MTRLNSVMGENNPVFESALSRVLSRDQVTDDAEHMGRVASSLQRIVSRDYVALGATGEATFSDDEEDTLQLMVEEFQNLTGVGSFEGFAVRKITLSFRLNNVCFRYA